ncbi:hypothetical protein QOV31_001662 [Agrobacterium fabrum]|nr:hypothetical protein At1D132_04850 [Agrobacterium fabrum]WJK74779.1 hypothetical protein QOV31_001662 [Agrobacterium fabrum]CAD0207726.1 hypothetical protein AGTUEHA105_LOCUS484 [Agrobacterium tumefaciens]
MLCFAEFEPCGAGVLGIYSSQNLSLKPHPGTSRSRVPQGSIASTTLFSISTST